MFRETNTTDKRRHTRFELLEYAILHPSDDCNPVRAVMVDISLGGMQVLSRHEFETGATFVAQIGRGDSTPVQVGIEALYCQPADSAEMFTAGFRFRPGTTKERVDIVDYVHEIFQSQGESLII